MEVIVGKYAGFCGGVKNSVSKAEQILKENKTTKMYCLGELVHNEVVIKKLETQGLTIVNSVSEVPEGSTMIIRAHGVPDSIYEEAFMKNISLVDLTCPKVLKVHSLAKELMLDGYYIILVGQKNHPEVIGTISFCGDNSIIVENEDELKELICDSSFISKTKVAMISQTTYSLNSFGKMEQMLKDSVDKYVDLKIHNTICNATMIRQNEVQELAGLVDKMIVIGGSKSSNTRKLYELSKSICEYTKLVESFEELDYNDYADASKVGVVAGASTPQESIDEVKKLLMERSV